MPRVRRALYRPNPSAWPERGLTATWIGHSTVLFDIDGTRILTDPMFGLRAGVHLWGPLQIGLRRFVKEALSPHEIGHVDVILLSHAHMDHLDVPSLRKLISPRTHVVTAKGISQLVPRGFASVRELAWNESLVVAGLRVNAFPVQHWGRRFPWNKEYSYNGYLFEKNGTKVLFPGDTAWMSFQSLRDLVGEDPIDLACMPIGAYSPASFERSHCTPEQAWQMFEDSGAKYLLPIHWNTFVLSQEPVHEPFKRLVAAAGESSERIVIKHQGETWRLPHINKHLYESFVEFDDDASTMIRS